LCVFLAYALLLKEFLVISKLIFQGEDHLERRESENLHTQMIKGEDHPHPTGTTQIIYPPKEMTEEFGMIGKLKWLLDGIVNISV